MSSEVLVRIRPGESIDAFTSRIADSAPPLTPVLADRLRDLLAAKAPRDTAIEQLAQPTRTAA